MATLTSEAEFERLYQEFVRRNGGLPTLVADQYNTPASYYKAKTETTLSPSELAELQAKQAQYNRQAALNTIAKEISNNTFHNPYNARSQASISNLNSITSLPVTINNYTYVNDPSQPNGIRQINNGPVQTTSYNQLGNIRNTLNILSDSRYGGSIATAAIVYAGISSATGIDIEKLLLGASLITAGVAMFGDLQSHTDNQASDIPGKLNEIDQLSGLQQSFGEMSNDSCSIFNELMGIMSGAFDGVLDFIDSGIDKFKEYMASTAVGQVFNQINGVISNIMDQVKGVFNQVAGGIGGMIDSIVGDVSSKLNSILEETGIKDILNSIGGIASGVMSGIGDMANQIAGEISKLVSMAADIANKLAALGLAGAMMDPCKMAVLLNTGSPALAGAASQLTAPIESTIPNLNIPTEQDTRANPQEVSAIMETARDTASREVGVPQSPFGALASLYTPFSAYLHNLIGTVSGVFGDTLEKVAGGNVLNVISNTSPNNSVLSSLNNITGDLQGTIGDISTNVPALISGSNLGTQVASQNITGSNTDNEDFSSGGAESNIPESEVYDDAILRNSRVSSASREPSRSGPENTEVTRVVTETTPEGTVSTLEGPSNQIAKARSLWKKQYQARYGRIVRDSRKLGREITKYLNEAKFRTPAQKNEASILREDVQRIVRDTTSYNKSQRSKFEYRSNTQDRDENKEKEILNEYNTVMQSSNNLFLERMESEVYDAQQFWNSLKGQAILG